MSVPVMIMRKTLGDVLAPTGKLDQ
jgi:hypothetical protein